jgi:hypothetical protein
MDPKKRAKGGGRVEIVREAVPRRKIRLSDIMSESFSRYLMELDGDFIAPTGLRMSELDEAEKSTGGQYTPDAVKRAQELQADDPTATPDSFLAQAERELSAPTPAAPVEPPATTPVSPPQKPTPPSPGVIHPGQAMLPDIEDDDTAPGADPQPPVVTPPGTDTQPTTVVTPPVTPPQPGFDDADSTGIVDGEETGNVDGVRLPGPDDETERDNSSHVPTYPESDSQLDDIASPGQQTDSADGGPDEFDEKNRPFTTQMDALIDDVTSGAAAGPSADVYSVSELAHRRVRSLVEAVYGPRILVIDRR